MDAAGILASAFADVGPEGLFDCHAHLVGTGAGGTGCRVNPAMRSFLHPIRRIVFSVIARAAGIRDIARADALYVERLATLAREFPVPRKALLLAFDRHHREDGTADERRSEFYVPNDFVLSVSAEHADVSGPRSPPPVPRRRGGRTAPVPGTRGALRQVAAELAGHRPPSPRCDPFYDALRETGMVLLCHTGKSGRSARRPARSSGTRSGCAARSTAACAS